MTMQTRNSAQLVINAIRPLLADMQVIVLRMSGVAAAPMLDDVEKLGVTMHSVSEVLNNAETAIPKQARSDQEDAVARRKLL